MKLPTEDPRDENGDRADDASSAAPTNEAGT
jgi:hypothetical protein